MIFHYAGKYNGDESKLPCKPHHPKAVPFKEPESTQKLSLIANIGGFVLILVLGVPFFILGKNYMVDNLIYIILAGICAPLSIFPHELLHAVCYKEDVYMYNDLAHGLMFVVGTEDMTRRRFIFMCLCPNLVLGLIPYLSFLLFHHLVGLGLFGAICLGTGFGDYLNVYNVMKQMPNNAKTYLCGIHSYWYL